MSMFVHFLYFFFRPVVVTDTGSVMSQKHGIFGYRACQSKTHFFEKFFVPRDSSPQKPLVNEVSAHFFIFEILAVFLLYKSFLIMLTCSLLLITILVHVSLCPNVQQLTKHEFTWVYPSNVWKDATKSDRFNTFSH